ncbi:diguanylate cyclase [Faecalitalea cylindroides]|uniref:Diguanylate cyclase n=1 Tax=Faecalitalea cylindroides TaxID=39483 RepID=A0A1Y4M2N7_9FIRM|nr:nitroreductase [Faecalitalea cylindroides]OUP60932.1 diguanylate cyclase [Faecalitalea cylindroides]
MNQAYENIIERRSCKSYKEQRVPKDVLEKIVAAGQMAPSGMNRQAYAFVVVQDKKMMNTISKLNASIMQSDTDPFYHADCVIIVFGKKDVRTHVYDGSLAMENLMLAANSLGVSSCWIHRAKEVFETEEGKELLKKWGLEEYEGIGNCILGYSDGEIAPRKPRTSKVVWE